MISCRIRLLIVDSFDPDWAVPRGQFSFISLAYVEEGLQLPSFLMMVQAASL
jgi:hypothetical protein